MSANLPFESIAPGNCTCFYSSGIRAGLKCSLKTERRQTRGAPRCYIPALCCLCSKWKMLQVCACVCELSSLPSVLCMKWAQMVIDFSSADIPAWEAPLLFTDTHTHRLFVANKWGTLTPHCHHRLCDARKHHWLSPRCMQTNRLLTLQTRGQPYLDLHAPPATDTEATAKTTTTTQNQQRVISE